MKNEDIKIFMVDVLEKREKLCVEHGESIKGIREDITEIKIELAKIVTAYKVFIAIGSAVGVLVGFIAEFFYRST